MMRGGVYSRPEAISSRNANEEVRGSRFDNRTQQQQYGGDRSRFSQNYEGGSSVG
jgi:hypothetical protein